MALIVIGGMNIRHLSKIGFLYLKALIVCGVLGLKLNSIMINSHLYLFCGNDWDENLNHQ